MMKWSRIFAVGAACALITASASAAFAADTLPLCGLSSCNETGEHVHYGSIHYAGHYLGDGHQYHETCAENGCAQTGVHSHDGTCYYGHSTAAKTTAKSSTSTGSGWGCGNGGHHSGGHHGGGHH